MYTLRLFKKVDEIDRTQINLGDESYQVKGVEEKDKKLGIKLRVFSNQNSHTREGICVYEDDYAYIITASGNTLERLNKPN